MPIPFPDARDFSRLLRLALPVVLIQVGMMLMGVVDTLMVGHLSAEGLAAVALGNLYFFGTGVLGMGILMVMDPVIAQAVGADDHPAIARGLQRGLVLAAALSLPLSLLLIPAQQVFTLARQPAEVIPLAAGYVYWMIPGVAPFLVFTVLRQGLQAMHRTGAILGAIVVANVANALLNYVLIFGHLGFGAHGVLGSAWATTISRWLMAILVIGLAWPGLREFLRPTRPEVWRIAPLGRMLVIGVPIGAMMLLEFGAFAAIALLMGRLGTIPVAGHQVAINLASLTFMVPLGVSMAAAVLVGNAIGAGDLPRARRSAAAALLAGAVFMSLTALLFLAAPGFFAGLYTRHPEVLAVAASLIPIAGIFQVFDGLQAVGAGILRGAGDTRVPMVINVLGFWCCGMPVSVYLGFRAGLGPRGLWWGFVAGLATVAILLLLRIRSRLGRQVARVQVEQGATG